MPLSLMPDQKSLCTNKYQYPITIMPNATISTISQITVSEVSVRICVRSFNQKSLY